jgi:hypothetical protein
MPRSKDSKYFKVQEAAREIYNARADKARSVRWRALEAESRDFWQTVHLLQKNPAVKGRRYLKAFHTLSSVSGKRVLKIRATCAQICKDALAVYHEKCRNWKKYV